LAPGGAAFVSPRRRSRAWAFGAALAAALSAASQADADCSRVDAWRGGLAAVLGKAAAGPVERDPALERFADRRAAAVARAGRLDHAGLPEAAVSSGLEACPLSELLSSGPLAGPEALLDRWRASPAHRALLEDPRATRHGLGVACPAEGPPVQALILAGPCRP
jgi:uncharacterized protein YkwD